MSSRINTIAIATKNLPATDTRGARVAARFAGHDGFRPVRTIESFDHGATFAENHHRVAVNHWADHGTKYADSKLIGSAQTGVGEYVHLFAITR